MASKQYKLKYLPHFERDLDEIVGYITFQLANPTAAMDLVNDIESAILERLNNPLSFEAFPSKRNRQYPYYRIYVNNFTIYYVVIDDVIEVRRILYNKRNANNIIK